MKRIKDSHQRIRLRQLSLLRQRRRIIKIKRIFNIKRNNAPKKNSTVPKKRNHNHLKVAVPKFFISEKMEESLFFINRTFKKAQHGSFRSIFFEMNEVERIDIFTICLMLSLINKLAGKNIHCWGNYPMMPKVKRDFVESGFLDVVKSAVKSNSHSHFKNQMFMIGKKCVDGKRVGESIKEVMEYMTGTKQHYAPVYDDILEICANSVEHANERLYGKNWLVSISLEKDSVHFILTDTGAGILNTLHKKKIEMFADSILFKKDYQVLEGVFNKSYQSQTGEINRHKGLPNVLESFNEGYIDNLIVLTNCVWYNFSTHKHSVLKNEFKGTLFSWTLSKKNIEKWKTSN